MKKLWLLLPLLLFLSTCGTAEKTSSEQEIKDLEKVTLVLDYVSNTNHIGIYLAKKKGYYKEVDLNAQTIESGDNSAGIGLVGANKAQSGVSYQEDITYAHADGRNIPVKATAIVIRHNTSGFAILSSSSIHSPKDFEGKACAGRQSPNGEAVLKAVMEKDGGDSSKLTMAGSNGEGPEGLGKSSGIQWYFEGWDMIKTEEIGIELDYIPLKELDERPNYYTPVVIMNDQLIKSDPELVRSFIDTTKRGYQEAIKDPNGSAKLLQKYAKKSNRTFLEESQAFLSKNYTDDPENRGLIEEKVQRNYIAFIQENGLAKQDVPSQELFTNQSIKQE